MYLNSGTSDIFSLEFRDRSSLLGAANPVFSQHHIMQDPQSSHFLFYLLVDAKGATYRSASCSSISFQSFPNVSKIRRIICETDKIISKKVDACQIRVYMSRLDLSNPDLALPSNKCLDFSNSPSDPLLVVVPDTDTELSSIASQRLFLVAHPLVLQPVCRTTDCRTLSAGASFFHFRADGKTDCRNLAVCIAFARLLAAEPHSVSRNHKQGGL